MSKWQEKRLGEIAEINPKVMLLKNKLYSYIDIEQINPVYRYVNGFINKVYTGQSCSKFSNGDTVFSRITPCLENRKIAQVKIDNEFGFGSTEFIVFREKPKLINQKFLYYLLISDNIVLPAINSMSGASGRQRADKNFIQKIKINIPDIATQEKIADILSTYDDLIENNNRRIEILEQMAQEIYKEWFVRFRFPGHEKVKYKSIKMTNWVFGNDSITMIPNSWHIGNVSKLALFKRGSNLTSAKMINGNIPVISAGIQPSGYHNVANVFGQSITVSASGANAGYLLYHLNDIWASDCSYLQSEYIWFIYNSLKFLQPVLNNLQCGAAQPHVYPKQINKIPIIIPTNEILKQYCSKVEPIYEHIKNLKEKNQNLIKQRDLLLPRLMSGKLEV